MALVPLSSAGPMLDALDPRVLFSDIDGTLVGQGGSLFATFEGELTLEPARSVLAAHRAGLRIVPMSGRPWERLRETARLLGVNDFIAELGTALMINGELEFLMGDVPRDLGSTPATVFQRAGVLDWLLDHHKGRLEPHDSLRQRQGTILLRGQLDDLDETNTALGFAGFEWAQLRDNGRFNRPFAHLGPKRTHAYHLAPAGVTKATAVARYLRRAGLAALHAAAIGDAPSDIEVCTEVGAMFLVENGRWAVENDHEHTIIATRAAAGLGWSEAIAALLGLNTSHASPDGHARS